jgi:hypothetical protein
MIRKTVGVLRGTFNSIASFRLNVLWSYGVPSATNEDEHTIHLLIVKNPVYVKLARICIKSFLHFNPNSDFKVHCDSATFSESNSVFKKLGNRVQIFMDISNEAQWQESKIDLILSMSGSSEIFMDADLRWNGPLPKLFGLTFFVEEFSMLEKSPERQAIRALNSIAFDSATMKNTSFVYLDRYVLSHSEKDLVREYAHKFEGLLDLADIGEKDRPTLMRLREQIIFSLISESWQIPIYFLKEIDSHRDGRFVESSYFGATGSSF